MSNTLTITLKKSPIGRKFDQRQTLAGLGLTKMHKTVELENTPSIRGMVKKVIHLVEVSELKA